MPSQSEAQHKLMEAAAHTVGGYDGVSQSVGKEFVSKDDADIETPPVVIPPAGRAAGILFVTPDDEILFVHRSDGGDFPRTWALPGGHQEDGETLEQCARREAEEETGFKYEGELEIIYDNGQFRTYAAKVDKFPVTVSDESTGYSWAKPDAAPLPLHPAMPVLMRVYAADTELAIAELMRDKILPSPQRYANVYMVDLRITGTGMAYRSSIEEHVFRDSSLYLNDEFLARCNGLPVVLDHPAKAILDGDEFKNRISGTCLLPYIRPESEEVWAIAKIYAQDAIAACEEAIESGEMISTSPSVVFNEDSENVKVMLENGKPLLIEGKPALLDHIALVSKNRGARGVWDKGGDATGVNLSNQELVMADEDKTKDVKADETVETKADASGDKMDKLLAAVDAMSKRMDALDERIPAEAIVDKKADAETDKEKEEAKADAETEKEEAEKKAKADADEKEKEEMKADAEHGKFADAQARADSVFAAFGDSAPRPLNGEGLMAYRRRLASKLKVHSADYKDINLSVIADAQMLAIAERKIYADAVAASRNPLDVQDGILIEVKSADRSGRQISTFRGHPDAWMRSFKSGARRVTQINKGSM